MPWINKRSYTQGQRHYFEGEVARTITATNADGRQQYIDRAPGNALCGATLSHPGWTGKYLYGGLSSKSQVNLMQGNLCGYCRKRYLEGRPDLAAAVKALKEATVESR